MKLKSALVFTLAAVGLHIYLALHYYGLTFGIASSESLCNVNATFNCDTVTASRFSALFGIPLAMWGAVTNGILAALLMTWILRWSSDVARLGRYTLWLSGFVALTSVVMGTLSTIFIGAFCLFCIGAYVASFVTFVCIWKAQETDHRGDAIYLREAFGPAKYFLFLLIAIPAAAWFFHNSYVSKVGGKDLGIAVRSSLAEWEASPVVDLSKAAPSMVKGPENAKMIISEFADFRCSHCKFAVPGVRAFMAAHPDVRMEFYSFPLDGACNSAMNGGGDGVSCFLAKTVLCAEKTAQQGWGAHDKIFEAQDEFLRNPSLEFAREKVAGILQPLKVPEAEQKACVESPETDTAIRAQAQAGQDSGLRGTPTFFVNGRKLNRGQLIPVLDAVYQKTK